MASQVTLPSSERTAIFQVLVGSTPWVCTDDELGTLFSDPCQPARIWRCLGSVWNNPHPDLGMLPLCRWTTPSSGLGDGGGGPILSKFATFSRMGFDNNSFETGVLSESPRLPDGEGWQGYSFDRLLGYTFPHTSTPMPADRCHIWNWQALPRSTPPGGPFFHENAQTFLPGWYGGDSGLAWNARLCPTPVPAHPPAGASFQLHAPQVVRVSYDPVGKQISVDPDELVVPFGTGAPIVWMRGDGFTGDGTEPRDDWRMSWSLAGLAFDHPRDAFVTRHSDGDQIIIVDNDIAGPGGDVFKYRISVLDHTDGIVRSLDPKVRNGSHGGSGGTGGGRR
jgi:hypothetical protein